MKDEFVSTVSHELRTPLTSIRGSLGLLSTGLLGEVNEKAANLLRIAVNNSDRLVRLSMTSLIWSAWNLAVRHSASGPARSPSWHSRPSKR